MRVSGAGACHFLPNYGSGGRRFRPYTLGMGQKPASSSLPPETVKALVEAWAAVLLADLAKNPPDFFLADHEPLKHPGCKEESHP
jgi:hypothetical protein